MSKTHKHTRTETRSTAAKGGKRRRERNCDNLVTNDVGDGAHFELLMSVSQEYMSTATDVDACDANLNENSTSEKCQLEEEEKTWCSVGAGAVFVPPKEDQDQDQARGNRPGARASTCAICGPTEEPTLQYKGDL